MHLTAFLCIFLPLYTHLGQAYIIFAAENLFYLIYLFIYLLLPPIHIQLAPFFDFASMKLKKKEQA